MKQVIILVEMNKFLLLLQERKSCTLEQLLMMSVKVDCMYRFLSDGEAKLEARTMMNYTAALQWHLIYLRYLLHTETIAADGTETTIQNIIRSKIKSENETCLQQLKECMKKIRSMMTK